jgi:hypothetical protein
VEAEAQRGSKDFSSVGLSLNRPICNICQSADSSVLLQVAGTSSLPCRCANPQLGEYVWLRFPTNFLDTTGSGQGAEVSVHSDTYRPFLASPVMVSETPGVVSGGPDSSPRFPRPVVTGSGVAPPSLPREAAIGGLETERRRLGFQEEVIETLQQSIRVISSAQYERLWGEFIRWCDPRKIDPPTAPVREILGFLQFQVNRGLAFRTIGVYRSAISKFHQGIEGWQLDSTHGCVVL